MIFSRHPLNANLGQSFTTKQLATLSNEAFGTLANKTFITFCRNTERDGLHHETWEKVWFPVLLNNKHIKFDDDLSMEICREKFGHTSFGIADGIQASRGNSQRDNL